MKKEWERRKERQDRGKKKVRRNFIVKEKKEGEGGVLNNKKNEKGRGNCKPGIKEKEFFCFYFFKLYDHLRRWGRIKKFKETKKLPFERKYVNNIKEKEYACLVVEIVEYLPPVPVIEPA